MNPAIELNKLIAKASRRSDFENLNFRSPDKKNQLKRGEVNLSNNIFLTSSVLGMEAISHVIEDQAIHRDGKFDFYTCCEKFSWLKLQEKRYEKLCSLGNPVIVYSIQDVKPWQYENLKVVDLDSSPHEEGTSFTDNWFVILNNPQFVSMALVARKLPSPFYLERHPKRPIYRNYEGFWTYNQTIIDEVVYILKSFSQSSEENQHNK